MHVCKYSAAPGNVRIENFHSGDEVKTPGSGSRNHVILITLITLFYYVRSRQTGAPAHARTRAQARGATPELRRVADTTLRGEYILTYSGGASAGK